MASGTGLRELEPEELLPPPPPLPDDVAEEDPALEDPPPTELTELPMPVFDEVPEDACDCKIVALAELPAKEEVEEAVPSWLEDDTPDDRVAFAAAGLPTPEVALGLNWLDAPELDPPPPAPADEPMVLLVAVDEAEEA